MSGEFENTRWSLVVQVQGAGAQDGGGQSARLRALDELCRIYWSPIYVYARRWGHSPEDAEDLTQQFFARVLEKELFGAADPEKGRLRSFLLTAMKRFLSDEHRARARIKRGGEARFIWIDADLAESSTSTDLCDDGLTPDQAFTRRWAHSFLEQSLRRLREEFGKKGKSDVYEALIPLLPENSKAEQSEGIAAAAQSLGLSDGAVRVALHRFRKRYREIIEDETAATLLPGESVQAELGYLMQAVSGAPA